MLQIYNNEISFGESEGNDSPRFKNVSHADDHESKISVKKRDSKVQRKT